MVILGLLAGATADIFDRRRLLIFWQAWMLTAVAILSVLTFFDIISPWILLILTFLLNIGTAMNSPAWQAIVPEVIPRAQLPDAISLNSAGFNLARALGPALGGMAIALFARATTGAASVFLLNSLSFVGVILVLYRWQRNPLFKSALPSERIRGSVRAGIRYIRYAPMLQAAFMRTLIFTLFVSAVWALLAVVARNDLHQGAMGYGILNGSMGFGAVIGATNLPRVRRVLSADAIIACVHRRLRGYAGGSGTGEGAADHYSHADCRWVCLDQRHVYAEPGGAGIGSGLGAGAGAGRLPDDLRRGHGPGRSDLGLYRGARFHFEVADVRGCRPGGHSSLVASLPCAARSAAGFQPPPLLAAGTQAGVGTGRQRGPVRVSIDYHIDPRDYAAFTKAIHQLRDVRLRDGAIRWGVYQDASDPGHLNETFVTESWLEYLRQRERFTASDLATRDRVWSFHRGNEPPRISHMFYAKEVSDAAVAPETD